jgi:hypothetical protein
MSTLDDIDQPDATLTLGGKERKLHFGFKAWKIIHRDHGGMKKILETAKDDPEGFVIEQLPKLLLLSLVPVEGEEPAPTIEVVELWLDDFDISGLKAINAKLMNAFVGSAPQKKEGQKNEAKSKEGADPQAAETE